MNLHQPWEEDLRDGTYRGSLLLSPTKYKLKMIVALIELTPRKNTSVWEVNESCLDQINCLQGIVTIVFVWFSFWRINRSDILDAVNGCLISLTERYAVLLIPFLPLLVMFNL